VPGLRLEYSRNSDLLGDLAGHLGGVGLHGTTSLIPQGLAQVVAFIHYGTEQAVPTYELGIYEGQPRQPVVFRHLVDPDAVIDMIADWATGPMRTGPGKRQTAAELDARARKHVMKAIQDALQPPAIRDALELPGVDAALLTFYFPRDQRGQMRSTLRVLLEVLEAPARKGARSLCRFVRFEGGLFTGIIGSEFVENQDHRWHTQPWRWRRANLSSPERWGTAELDRARTSVDLLAIGKWQDAMSPWGVTLGDTLNKILAAEPLGHLYRDLTAGWATVAAEQLGGCAPWRLALLATQKSIRLFGLGGMNVQSKPGVFLRLRDGQPRLDYGASASNLRLAREEWERPLDFEAYRLGIKPPAALPLNWP
jgi:hypothetical protein